MSGAWTIYRRELGGLFLGPLAWVLLFLALGLNGIFFTWYLVGLQGNVDQAMSLSLGDSPSYWILMLLMPPLLTMRLISEEARSGVFEFLLTAPVTDAAVVVGKLLAATTLMAVVWSSALLYGLVLSLLGAAPDWGRIIGALLGAVLASGFFCSVGLMTSAATSTPLLAAFFALVLNTLILSMRFILTLVSIPRGHWVEDVLRQIDVIGHAKGAFEFGVIDTADGVFFLAWTFFFVFVSIRLVEARRWK